MAIERFNLTSDQDLFNLIYSLEWFDNLEWAGLDIRCYIGDDYYIVIHAYTGSSTSGTPGMWFYPLGYGKRGATGAQSRQPNLNMSRFYTRYAFKTKNGLLIMSDLIGTPGVAYNAFMICKTNAGEIAVVMPYNLSSDYSEYIAMAVGETCRETYQVFRLSPQNPQSTFFKSYETKQLVSVPIPTFPNSGTSYVKGALGFILAPFNQAGIVEIDGIKYATNGVLALNDED